MPAGDPFTHEFSTSQPPEELVRALVVAHTEDFARCGYRIESRSSEAVILSRRYIPESAYRVPLLVGMLFGLLSVIVTQPNALARVGQLMLILAIVLAIFGRPAAAAKRGRKAWPAVPALWPRGHRLHGLRWHDLRHTCAALSLGVAPNPLRRQGPPRPRRHPDDHQHLRAPSPVRR